MADRLNSDSDEDGGIEALLREPVLRSLVYPPTKGIGLLYFLLLDLSLERFL